MNGPVPVLVNASGGTARRLDDRLRPEIEAAFVQADVPIALELLDGDAIAARVAALVEGGAMLVVVGGGDGTLGSAAGALAGTGCALGILPLGTHNHLALELGVPSDLSGAAALIAGRGVRRVDIGRVNGRAFVNNASIGLYPAIVRRREGMAVPKWLAALPAAAGALARMRHHRLRLVRGDEAVPVITPLLFVGNGHYSLQAGRLGSRASLGDGRLSIYAVGSRRRLALVGFALRALAGRADPERDFAALDGKVVRLSMPLRFESVASGLAVVAPEPASVPAPAA